MTSPKEARPPVKRALKPAPPQANLTVLPHCHVHSTHPKHQVELLAVPGSQPEVIHINTNAVPQPFLDAALLQKEP
ncbi:hypothetical protein LMH87_006524 [Akanthomyces muscarius]|uniref:Uncharacterized protein n=1 Tax=Akanthomyces muscarius TaxID=2231603 RepID=A0A9W8QPR4_AKAMU|nr:hypothetical protein LMH87_006524 [Akanthomyces muscarius]KAJ4164870.1 hypothetical protein LMH87_006524 [Akanthomyces muscarius]